MQDAQLSGERTASLKTMQVGYAAAMDERRPYREWRAARLRQLLIEAGGPNNLAGRAGTEATHLIAIAKGRRQVGDDLADKLEQAVGRPRGWMDLPPEAAAVLAARDAVPPDGYVRLPVLAEAAAGAGRATSGELVCQVDALEAWLRQTLRTNPRTVRVLTARGHSMTGLIEDGDVMFIEPCTQFETDGLYVLSVDDLLRVKRLRLRVVDRLLSIESNDGSAPETASLEDVGTRVRIHGRVVAAWNLRRL